MQPKQSSITRMKASTHTHGAHCIEKSACNSGPAYREMVVSVFVDFSGGCTGAGVPLGYKSQKLCIWIISFSTGGSTLGPPHKAAHMPENPKIPQNLPSMSAWMWWLWSQAAGNKLWQTHNITERRNTENGSCFLSFTLSNTPALMGKKPWKCVFQLKGQKKALSHGWDWWQEDYWSSTRMMQPG